MSMRWWVVCSTLFVVGFMLLSAFIGSGTNCPGLPTGHAWVADCTTAVEKLEARINNVNEENENDE